MTLPVAAPWYSRREVSPGVTLIGEPHVDVLLQANIWHVRGRDRDLLIDAGNGIAPLRAAFPDLFEGDRTILALTHAHSDHMGAAHEFAERLVHPAEAGLLADPGGGSLLAERWDAASRALFVRAGYPPMPELLIDALPEAGCDPAAYRLVGAPATGLLADGDLIDLGDKRFEVLHVPGHSPGSVAFWNAAAGELFAGDVVYDGPLIWEGPGTSLRSYRTSFERLRRLPAVIVHAGHDPSFGRVRLHAIMDEYLRRWEEAGLA